MLRERWHKHTTLKPAIRTLTTDMDVVLLIADLDFSTCVFGFRERIEGLEVLDVCGHKTERGVLLGRRVECEFGLMKSGERLGRWLSGAGDRGEGLSPGPD